MPRSSTRVAGVAASVHRICNDIRLLAGMKQIEEPFEAEQVGSSAMAYKRNPMRCERATGLSRFVISLANSAAATAAEQWFERTLDDSANAGWPPRAFPGDRGCLQILINVARGLVVYPKVIESYVNAELPFMATEEILMAGVKAGGDRQELHELVRQHSQAAAQEVKMQWPAQRPDARLKADRGVCQASTWKMCWRRASTSAGPRNRWTPLFATSSARSGSAMRSDSASRSN